MPSSIHFSLLVSTVLCWAFQDMLHRIAQYNPEWATLYGFTKDEGTGQYLMVGQYFAGGDIQTKLRRKFAHITWQKKMRWVNDISYAIHQIHDAGLVHR